MKCIAPFAIVVAALLVALTSRGDPPAKAPAAKSPAAKSSAAKSSAAKGEPNPVQVEMRLLNEAMRDSVSAIAAGDVRALPKQLHAVHMAADKTKKATGAGEYQPPRNADKLDAFRALDAEFHREMIQMVKAARKNDVPRTAELFGKLMVRCNGCHATYR